VVITGLGPVAPNAIGAEEFHKAQLECRSGIGRITRFDPSPLRCQIAGEVKISPEDYLDKKEMRRLDRFVQLALIAAGLALQDSGL
ncbi:beta-ketoacyl synthase N-terminal-like domain-containing protein, partial [Salmonella enterica]|uniref:beta-ketoacyl synthase N-terminal-like domain-containing protein n=1 Tax=Salmonella enterica TaxID=28901 RepID=UPI003CF1F540